MAESLTTIRDWVREGLAYDDDLGLADKELVPDEAVDSVIHYLKTMDKKALDSFENPNEVLGYIDSVFLIDEENEKRIQEIVQHTYFCGLIRDNKCFITRGESFSDKEEHVEILNHSIDAFLSHVFHKDWSLDFNWETDVPDRLIRQAEEWEKKNEGILFFFPIRKLKKLPNKVLMVERLNESKD